MGGELEQVTEAAAPEAVAEIAGPQAGPATATAAAARGAALMRAMGGAAPPVDPSALLALGGAIGNRALASRMPGAAIQRDDAKKEDEEAVSASDFAVTGGVPVGQGPVTIKGSGDEVEAESPNVEFHGSVALADGKTLKASANVGYIQNLVSSDRAGVYRRGGAADGEIVSESHSSVKHRYDAVLDPDALKKGQLKKHPGVFPPWYWPPKSISAGNTGGNKIDFTEERDQPVAIFKAKVGDGRLTAIKGSDNFKLGLAVRKPDSGATIMLTASEWSVKWDGTVDANMNGTGAGLTTKVLSDLSKGPDAGIEKWSFDEADVWEGFGTLEEAKKRSADELLQWIFAAREHDQTAYGNICQALDQKDPTLTGTVTCDSTDRYFTSDTVSASIKRDGQLVKSVGGMSLNNGESDTISVKFSEAFGSASSLAPGTKLTLEISVGSDGLEAHVDAEKPFTASAASSVGSGKYTLSLGLGA